MTKKLNPPNRPGGKHPSNKFSQFFFNQFRKNETRLHQLSYLFWECTRRCNLRCLHCGSDCSAGSETEDLPFDDFLGAILPLKEVYKPESITVAITGGEPLVRKNLSECGRRLRQHGFLWGIVTNGYAYTPGIHGRLLAAGMGSVSLSLDGLEASHNWLRGNDQSFNRAVDALALITSTKHLTYDVITCVNQKNIYELEELKAFLVSRNVRVWRLCTIAPIGRAARNGDLCLSPGQLKYLFDFIVNSRTGNDILVEFSCESWAGEYERRIRDAPFFCRAGINIASVLVDGSISACPNINRSFVQGNIYRDLFLDVWNNRFKIMRDRRWTKTGICKDCKDYRNCSGGPMHLRDEKKDAVLTCIYNRL
ncbi:MAG: TIGR04133 family radical SAM/SPASM protein [Treponema sp.]|jgi:radical SAM enzyme (rSAM/lipoprotein system)|nr:TIGR04133 family radical SAM/SPASM protein [Treponema sp.]